MAEKCKDAGGASVPAKEICIERLAFDLFQHITHKFHLQPQVIRQSNLPKNKYTSKTFIQDIARPVLYDSLIHRATIEKNCERTKAETLADERNALVYINDRLFHTQYISRERPIYSNVQLSLIISLELTQYLHAKGKRKLLKIMPEIWADLFKNRLHHDLEQNGGFEDYISYWEFLKPTDELVSIFLERCTQYDGAVSAQFMKDLRDLSWYRLPETQKKLTDVGGVSRESESPMDPKPNVARSKKLKLKPKTYETYSRFVAERRAMKREKEMNVLAKGVEKMGQVDPDEENTS